MKQDKQKIVKLLSEKDNFLITTFETDKIEALAGVLALGEMFTELNKNFYLFLGEESKINFDFLPSSQNLTNDLSGKNLLILVSEEKSKLKKMLWERKDGFLRLEIVSKGQPFTPQDVSFSHQKPQIDYIIVVGSSRFSASSDLVKYKDRPVINIDYHQDNASFGHYNWVDERAFSLSEMLVSLVESLETTTNKNIKNVDLATLLYAGILWRTKGLSGKVPSKVFSVVAQLIAWKANKIKIDRSYWQTISPELLPILGMVFERAEFQNGYFIFSLPFSKWSSKKNLFLKNINLIINEIKHKTFGLSGLILILENEKNKGLVWANLDAKKIAAMATFIDWHLQNKHLSQGETLTGFKESRDKIKQILF
ncbi:MAG: hypothetical protein PHW50_00285 [Patescibacteria group bacterium]|nr:hypothetical protein [Patescibacteria group bacterium]